jgi:ribosome-associated heat shock protein Hsp15
MTTVRSSVRMDKWLWAARFFKTRALAARACDLGRILSNGNEAKPSRDVHAGDRLHIRTEAGDFHVEVRALSEIRGPAAVAQTLYHETDESRELRQKLAEERRAAMQQGLIREGKPSRRDRQELNRVRGRF